VIVVVLWCVAIFLGAAYLFLVGWDALSSREITVFRKGHPSITLTPSSSFWWFYGEVWIRLISGGLLLAVGVAIPVFLAFVSPQRRAERLRIASLARVRHGGPNVSWLVLTLLLLGFAVLVYIWIRHVT
jgi:hypothetical protein